MNNLNAIAMSGSRFIDEGIWYQSAATGLWYQNKAAAGDICAIRRDGITEYMPEPEGWNTRGQEDE